MTEGSHLTFRVIYIANMLYETEHPKVYSTSDIVLDIYSKPITWFKPYLTTLGQFFLYNFKVKPKEIDGSKLLKKQIIRMRNGSEIKVGVHRSSYSPRAVVLYLHTVAGNYTQSAHLADKLKKDNISYVSYTRAGNDNELKCTNYNFIGHIDELHIVIQYITAIFPGVPIHAIGASAGSALLIRYLSKYNQNKYIKSGVLVSPGYDFIKSFDMMGSVSKSYLVNKMKFTVRNISNKTKLEQVRSMDDWVEFQSQLLNYRNANEFIAECNPSNFIHLVNVPTLCISSLDDPIFSGEITNQYLDLPKKNSNITILTTKKGGHVMFDDYGHEISWFIRVIHEWVLNRIQSQ